MFLNIFFMALSYITQKILLATSKETNNPIHPFEWLYWISLILLVLFLFWMQFVLKESLFPIPKNVRFTYLVRCFIGMLCNLFFLLSIQYISFSKASVLFWTSPVFTAVMGKYFLKEGLSNYDWGAVFIAFIGLLII